MGARRPPNERPQRGGIKCEFCGRTITSVASLRAHHRILHSQALKEKMKRGSTQVQQPKRAAPKARPKNPKTTSVENAKVAQKSKPTVEKQKSSTPQEMNKVVDKTEPEKFIAQETLDSTNSDCEIVSLDSPSPVQLKKLLLSSNHKSSDLSKQSLEVYYECSECQKSFKTTALFNKHVDAEHTNLILSYCFLHKEEFLAWKKELEDSTKCTYVTVQELPKKTTYSCKEFMTLDNNGHPQFCPSTIISSNTSGNKFHVDLYTSHYGHEHEKFDLQIGSTLNRIQKVQSEDLYVKFQTLMENIVLDAAKLKINKLKILYDKALELKAIVNNYNEDDDEIETEPSAIISISTVTTNSSHQEISNVPLKTRKRSTVEDATPAKKIKVLTKKSNTFSLADDRDDNKILKELDDPNNIKTTPQKLLKSTLKELDNPNNIKTTPQKLLKSTSFADTYKEFIDKTIKSKKLPPKKKNFVKTKMGIFKPNWPNGMSPKKEKRTNDSSPREERRLSIGQVKDVEYEVREQENDCNILVLKL